MRRKIKNCSKMRKNIETSAGGYMIRNEGIKAELNKNVYYYILKLKFSNS
jgi:hypothetical protein